MKTNLFASWRFWLCNVVGGVVNGFLLSCCPAELIPCGALALVVLALVASFIGARWQLHADRVAEVDAWMSDVTDRLDELHVRLENDVV